MAKQKRAKERTGRRKLEQREYDLTLVSSLYLQGATYEQIRERVLLETGRNLALNSIVNDIANLKERWRSAQLESLSYYTIRELEKIDAVEVEAWRQWERSKGDAEKEQIRQKGMVVPEDVTPEAEAKLLREIEAREQAPSRAGRMARAAGKVVIGEFERTDTREGRTGDPRYLVVILQCSEKRIKLLGLERAPKRDATAEEEEQVDHRQLLDERIATMKRRREAAKEIGVADGPRAVAAEYEVEARPAEDPPAAPAEG